MHGLSSVEFSIIRVSKLQNGENCCGVIWSNKLNEIFKYTKSGKIPKFGTDDSSQLAI